MGSCKPCNSIESSKVRGVIEGAEVAKEVSTTEDDVDTDIAYVRDQVKRTALRNNNRNYSQLVFEDSVPRDLRARAVSRYRETNRKSLEYPDNYEYGEAISAIAAVTFVVMLLASFVSDIFHFGFIGGALPTVLTLTIMSCFFVWDASSPVPTYNVPLTKDELKALKGNFHVRTSATSKATALPEVAGEILNQIEGSLAWNSEYLALERLQLNLDEEFTQIARVCRKLESMREIIKSHKESDFEDPSLRDELKFRKAAYEQAYAVVERRVATLYAYYTSLGEVETIIKQLDAANELRDTRSAFDDLLNEVALSELATAHVESLRVNLDALKENLEARLQFIRTNVVNNPMLDRPLALQN